MGILLKSGLLVIVLLTAPGIQAGEAASHSPEAKPKPQQLPPHAAMLPPELIPDPSELFSQLEQLSQLISMDQERLRQLRMTIEFIERLSPEEREAMHLKLARIREVSPERKDELNNLIPYISPKLHSDLSQLWMAASAAERKSIQEDIADLSNKQKGRYLVERINAFVEYRESVFSELKTTLAEQKSSPEK